MQFLVPSKPKSTPSHWLFLLLKETSFFLWKWAFFFDPLWTYLYETIGRNYWGMIFEFLYKDKSGLNCFRAWFLCWIKVDGIGNEEKFQSPKKSMINVRSTIPLQQNQNKLYYSWSSNFSSGLVKSIQNFHQKNGPSLNSWNSESLSSMYNINK